MHHLHTVYSTLDNPPSILILILVCIAFILVVYFCITMYFGVGRDAKITLNTGNKVNPFLAALVPVTFLFLGFLYQNILNINVYRHDKAMLNSNQLKTVEGIVDDYSPASKDGHGDEGFTVQGVEFHYSHFEEGRSGYHETSWYGGVIRPNLYVRIGYYFDGDRNAILKLETE